MTKDLLPSEAVKAEEEAKAASPSAAVVAPIVFAREELPAFSPPTRSLLARMLSGEGGVSAGGDVAARGRGWRRPSASESGRGK